jgi:hypothetical protein
VHSWNTFSAWTNHRQTWIHKTHHGPDLGEATTFPFIVFYAPSHEASTQVGVPKFPKLGLLQLWSPIILCVNLQLRWGLKQRYNPCQELLNSMWHATCMQGNWSNFWLLVVENQIGNFTPGPSFGHNLFLSTQMGHANPFYTSTFKEFFNDIKNFSIQWVLTPAIAL